MPAVATLARRSSVRGERRAGLLTGIKGLENFGQDPKNDKLVFGEGREKTDVCDIVAKVPELLNGGQLLTTANNNVWLPTRGVTPTLNRNINISIGNVATTLVEAIVEQLAPVLAALPVPLVIDHIGRIDPAEGVHGEAYTAMRRLLDAGNTWVKLSGVYMRSRDGAPAYRDCAAMGRALVEAAPERLVWGSDWPHTTENPNTVNDADLADVLAAWCPSVAVRSRILVDNPAKLYGFAAG